MLLRPRGILCRRQRVQVPRALPWVVSAWRIPGTVPVGARVLAEHATRGKSNVHSENVRYFFFEVNKVSVDLHAALDLLAQCGVGLCTVVKFAQPSTSIGVPYWRKGSVGNLHLFSLVCSGVPGVELVVFGM